MRFSSETIRIQANASLAIALSGAKKYIFFLLSVKCKMQGEAECKQLSEALIRERSATFACVGDSIFSSKSRNIQKLLGFMITQEFNAIKYNSNCRSLCQNIIEWQCSHVSCLPHEDGVRPRYVPASELCRNLLNGTGAGFSRTCGKAGSSISNPFDCFFRDILMTHTHLT